MNDALRRLRSPGAIDVLSVLLVLAAVAARFAPLGEVTADAERAERASAAWIREPVEGSATPVAARSGDSTTFAGIVRTNLFSPTRRAPATRFVSPMGSASATDVPATDASAGMSEPSSMAASENAPTGDYGPTVYGIVSVDGERRALIALLADRPPQLLRVGDRQGAFRVLSIEQDRVRVQTPGGVRTLRLQRAAPPGTAPDTLIPLP